jgi:pyroglutamyl-peptidase
MAVTVLITGFGPFPGSPFNPTAPLVTRLAARRRPSLVDVRRIAHVFETNYAAIDGITHLIAHHRPDVVLMFGLAPRTPYLRIETRALNAVSTLFPDASGNVWKSRRIRAGGADMLPGRAPFRRVLSMAHRARVPARLSCNAGAYLCNFAYWRALEAGAAASNPPLVLFVHVPRFDRKMTPRQPQRRPRLRFEDIVRAGEAILIALVSAARVRR